MRFLLVLTILVSNIYGQIDAQQDRSEFVQFIGQQLSKTKREDPTKAARALGSALSSRYRLKQLHPNYISYFTDVIAIQRKSKETDELRLFSDRLYIQAIAAVFYQEDDQFIVKSMDCESAKSELSVLLRELTQAISNLMDCIQSFDWADAYNHYQRLTSLDGIFDTRRIRNSNDPNHPDYLWEQCRREVGQVRNIEQQIRLTSYRCD